MMTKEQKIQLVTDAATALLKQGNYSYRIEHGKVSCQYRNADGRKCALGVLLPDELYIPAMESLSASALIEQYESVRNYFYEKYGVESMNEYDKYFLRQVQSKLHDARADTPTGEVLPLLTVNEALEVMNLCPLS